jgi:uncharacterized membrane protein YeaQ/YmgE (transglycosylase-associated protein family)
MERKTLIWIGLFLGSTVGGWLPTLWGESFLSFTSVITTAIGSVIGIWAGFKLYNVIG